MESSKWAPKNQPTRPTVLNPAARPYYPRPAVANTTKHAAEEEDGGPGQLHVGAKELQSVRLRCEEELSFF